MALNNACRDSTYIIANLWVRRREACLGRLRPSFLQVKKGILRRCTIFTPFLFDEDRLEEALQSSKSNANRTLHEAALRSLARLCPALGTPLVERGPRPSTTIATRPSTAPTRRPPVSTCARDSRGGFFSSHSSHPGGRGGWRGRRTSPFGSDNLPHQGAIAGCLAHRWEGWLKIGAETWILDVLREGYGIPFSAPSPLTTHFKEPRGYASGSFKGQALRLEIQQLKDKGAIEEVYPILGFYSHMFVVLQVSGGFRPIIDLSIPNKYLSVPMGKGLDATSQALVLPHSSSAGIEEDNVPCSDSAEPAVGQTIDGR
ncbi:hypothetical protein E2C01_061998 [Portunus trituberculatus]|uniref:Uncharacterized protein n=1 Tax=Portunus trituberculatus TaxID=210409 RepID=A0A5B7H9T1_PORTR|nr:hypothetical protein [Portunus trituberculatus]